MNPKRWMVLIFYAAYVLLMVSLGFVYQITHRYDPPQSLAVSIQKAFINVIAAQYCTLLGIVMFVIFAVWFVTAKTRRRRS